MKVSAAAVIATTLLIAGCGQKAGALFGQGVECTSANATSTTIDLVKQQLEGAASKSLSSSSQVGSVGESSIRASISQFVISLDDIRTTKTDPNSTKKFCTANLKIRVPAQTLTDADKARSDANLPSVAALANQFDVERDADAFKVSFDYDVQPTDNGDKVFAESDNFDKLNAFFGEIISSSLLKTVAEQAKIQQQQAQNAQQQQQTQAATEQKNADLESAKADYQLAQQTINAVWKNLPPEQQSVLLGDERAWIQKRNADCNVAAASASIDPTEQQTARVKCDIQETRDRTQVLQQQQGGSGASPG